MPLLDAAGESHPGMFEETHFRHADAKATPTSGRGGRTRMKASGPDATAGPVPYETPFYHGGKPPSSPGPKEFDVCSGRPRAVERAARMRGAIKSDFPEYLP